MNYSLHEIIWLFIIYAFLGWCLEVIYATVKTGKFVNRGFLNGPYCPIYGFGAIIVLLIFEPFKSNLLIMFVGSVVLTTLLELVTGFILERIFNQKWWDYSKEPYNFMGYVCLWQSLVWGLACVFVIYVLQPFVGGFIHLASGNIGRIVQSLLVAAILADVAITLIVLLKIKKKFLVLSEIGDKIRNLSNAVGKNISDNTKNVLKVSDNNIQELELLRKRYQSLFESKVFGYKRIVKAFPKLGSIKPKKPRP